MKGELRGERAKRANSPESVRGEKGEMPIRHSLSPRFSPLASRSHKWDATTFATATRPLPATQKPPNHFAPAFSAGAAP